MTDRGTITVAGESCSDKLPTGVAVIAAIFFSSSAYVLILGVAKLASAESVSLSLGASLLHGFELAGPYAFLLAAVLGTLVGYGLLKLKSLARRAAIAIAMAGMVMLLPKVSAMATDFSPRFFLAGSMIVIRVMIVWYLWQNSTAEKFH